MLRRSTATHLDGGSSGLNESVNQQRVAAASTLAIPASPIYTTATTTNTSSMHQLQNRTRSQHQNHYQTQQKRPISASYTRICSVVPANVAVKRAIATAQRASAAHTKQQLGHEDLINNEGTKSASVHEPSQLQINFSMPLPSFQSTIPKVPSPSAAARHGAPSKEGVPAAVALVRPSGVVLRPATASTMRSNNSISSCVAVSPASASSEPAAPMNTSRPQSALQRRGVGSVRFQFNLKRPSNVPVINNMEPTNADNIVVASTSMKLPRTLASRCSRPHRSAAYLWSIVRNAILSGALEKAERTDSRSPFAHGNSTPRGSVLIGGASTTSVPHLQTSLLSCTTEDGGEDGVRGSVRGSNHRGPHVDYYGDDDDPLGGDHVMRVPTAVRTQPPNTIKSLSLPDVLLGVPLYVPRCDVNSVALRVFQGSPSYLAIFHESEINTKPLLNVVSSAFWCVFVNNFRPISAGSEYTIGLFANFSYFYALYHLQFAERHKGASGASATGGLLVSVAPLTKPSSSVTKKDGHVMTSSAATEGSGGGAGVGVTSNGTSLPTALAWQEAVCRYLTDVLLVCFDLALPADYSQVGSATFKQKVATDIALWITGLPGTTSQSVDPVHAAAEKEDMERTLGKRFFEFSVKDSHISNLQRGLGEVTKSTFASLLKEDAAVLHAAAMDSAYVADGGVSGVLDGGAPTAASPDVVDAPLLTRHQILQQTIQNRTVKFEDAIRSIQLPELLKSYMSKHFSHQQKSDDFLEERARQKGQGSSPVRAQSPARTSSASAENENGPTAEELLFKNRFKQISAGHYSVSDVMSKRGLSVESLSPVFRTFLSCCVVSAVDRQTLAFGGHTKVTGPARRSAAKNKWLWSEGSDIDKRIFKKQLSANPSTLSKSELLRDLTQNTTNNYGDDDAEDVGDCETIRQALGTELGVYQLSDKFSVDQVLSKVERARCFHTGLSLERGLMASQSLGCCPRGHGLLRLKADISGASRPYASPFATDVENGGDDGGGTTIFHQTSYSLLFDDDGEAPFDEALDNLLDENENVRCCATDIVARKADRIEKEKAFLKLQKAHPFCCLCSNVEAGEDDWDIVEDKTAVDRCGLVLHCVLCSETYCRQCAKDITRRAAKRQQVADNAKRAAEMANLEESLVASPMDRAYNRPTSYNNNNNNKAAGSTSSKTFGMDAERGEKIPGDSITPQLVFGDVLYVPILPLTRVETNQSRVKLLVEAIKRTKYEEERCLKIVAAHKRKTNAMIKLRNGVFMRSEGREHGPLESENESSWMGTDGGMPSGIFGSSADGEDDEDDDDEVDHLFGVGSSRSPTKSTSGGAAATRQRPQSSPSFRSGGFNGTTTIADRRDRFTKKKAATELTFGDFLAGRRVESTGTTTTNRPLSAVKFSRQKEDNAAHSNGGNQSRRPATAAQSRTTTNVGREHFERATAQSSAISGGHARRTAGFYESGLKSVQQQVDLVSSSPPPPLRSKRSQRALSSSPSSPKLNPSTFAPPPQLTKTVGGTTLSSSQQPPQSPGWNSAKRKLSALSRLARAKDDARNFSTSASSHRLSAMRTPEEDAADSLNLAKSFLNVDGSRVSSDDDVSSGSDAGTPEDEDDRHPPPPLPPSAAQLRPTTGASHNATNHGTFMTEASSSSAPITIRSMKDLRQALSGYKTGGSDAASYAGTDDGTITASPLYHNTNNEEITVASRVSKPFSTTSTFNIPQKTTTDASIGAVSILQNSTTSTSASEQSGRSRRPRSAGPSTSSNRYAATVETTSKTTLYNHQTRIARHTTTTFAVHQHTHSAQVIPWSVPDPNTTVGFKRKQEDREAKVKGVLERVSHINGISKDAEEAHRRDERRLHTAASKAQVEALQQTKKMNSINKSASITKQKESLAAVVQVMETLSHGAQLRTPLEDIYRIKEGLVTIERHFGSVPHGTRESLHTFVCGQRIRLKAMIHFFKNNNRDRSFWPKGLSSLYDLDEETEGNLVSGTAPETTDGPAAAQTTTTAYPASTVAKRRSSSLSSSSNLFSSMNNNNNNNNSSRTISRTGSVIGVGGDTGVLVGVPQDDCPAKAALVEYLSSSEDDSEGEEWGIRGGFANLNACAHASMNSSPKSVRPIMVPSPQDGSAAQARFGAWMESRDSLITAVYDPKADADREAEALRKIRHEEREKVVPSLSNLFNSSNHANTIESNHGSSPQNTSLKKTIKELIDDYHMQIEMLAGVERGEISKDIVTVGGALTWKGSGLGVGTRAHDYLIDLRQSHKERRMEKLERFQPHKLQM